MRRLNGLTAVGVATLASVALAGVLGVTVTPASAGTQPDPRPGSGSASGGVVSPLIVGGQPASEPYPAMASLQTRVGDDPDWHFCGGTVFHAKAIVVNAHCVTLDDASPVPAGLIHVRVGSHDRTSGGHVAAVTEIRVHPGWDWASGDGPVADVAVLKLDQAVPVAPMPIAGQPQWAGVTRLLGWGLTDPEGTALPVGLHEMDTRLVSRELCAAAGIGVGELCVGNPRPGVGPCYGDSGGPAMQSAPAGQRGGVGQWQAVGGASRETHPVCGEGPASVYTDLSFYRQWIWAQVFTGKPLPGINPPDRTGHLTAADTAAGRARHWASTWPGVHTG